MLSWGKSVWRFQGILYLLNWIFETIMHYLSQDVASNWHDIKGVPGDKHCCCFEWVVKFRHYTFQRCFGFWSETSFRWGKYLNGNDMRRSSIVMLPWSKEALARVGINHLRCLNHFHFIQGVYFGLFQTIIEWRWMMMRVVITLYHQSWPETAWHLPGIPCF